jgi:hypothetical protein
VIESVGDGDPQAGKQVREFLRPQFPVLEIKHDVPEIGDIIFAPVGPGCKLGVKDGRAEEVIVLFGICPPLMTPAEEANKSIRFAGYIGKGD